MNTVRRVEDLNNMAMRATQQIATFKSNLLQNVLSCKKFIEIEFDNLTKEAIELSNDMELLL